MKMSENRQDGLKDLYDSEKKKLREIAHTLRLKHSFRGVTTLKQEADIKFAFEQEAIGRCAEIGLIVSVQWDPEVSDDPEDNNLYWNPRIIVSQRVTKLAEFDHDRQQFEITHGVLEEPGFIRPDGSISEDPRKKNIY
jgi:hypothetical protein